MSTSDPVTATNSTPKKRKPKLRKWTILFSILGISLIVFVVIRTQGNVRGQEFSPTHFLARDFSFYEIPFLHIQITPIHRSGVGIPTAGYVRQNGLIKTPKGVPEEWDLVQLSRGLSGTTTADAELLIHHLQLDSAGGSAFWKTWSADNKEQATVLWPVVQRLAERELYILIPAVFELAQNKLSAKELDSRIQALLQEEYRELITDMRDAQRIELAGQLLKEAIGDYPDSESLKSLQASIPISADPLDSDQADAL